MIVIPKPEHDRNELNKLIYEMAVFEQNHKRMMEIQQKLEKRVGGRKDKLKKSDITSEDGWEKVKSNSGNIKVDYGWLRGMMEILEMMSTLSNAVQGSTNHLTRKGVYLVTDFIDKHASSPTVGALKEELKDKLGLSDDTPLPDLSYSVDMDDDGNLDVQLLDQANAAPIQAIDRGTGLLSETVPHFIFRKGIDVWLYENNWGRDSNNPDDNKIYQITSKDPNVLINPRVTLDKALFETLKIDPVNGLESFVNRSYAMAHPMTQAPRPSPI